MTAAATRITASAPPQNGRIHQVRRAGRAGGRTPAGAGGLASGRAGGASGPAGGSSQGGRPAGVLRAGGPAVCGRKLPSAVICPPVDDEAPRSAQNGILTTTRPAWTPIRCARNTRAAARLELQGDDPAITGEPPEERATARLEPGGLARHSQLTSGRQDVSGRQARWYRGTPARERARRPRG